MVGKKEGFRPPSDKPVHHRCIYSWLDDFQGIHQIIHQWEDFILIFSIDRFGEIASAVDFDGVSDRSCRKGVI